MQAATQVQAERAVQQLRLAVEVVRVGQRVLVLVVVVVAIITI